MSFRAYFWAFALLSAILTSALIYPATPLNTVTGAISQFCGGMQGILPAASMLMVLIGAVVYASGQIMGAETRARANVWATAALTGALVGLLISSVAPTVLETIYGQGQVSCTAANCGSLTCSESEFCCNIGGTCCTTNSISCQLNGCGGCGTFFTSCSVDSDCCSGNCIPGGFGFDYCG